MRKGAATGMISQLCFTTLLSLFFSLSPAQMFYIEKKCFGLPAFFLARSSTVTEQREAWAHRDVHVTPWSCHDDVSSARKHTHTLKKKQHAIEGKAKPLTPEYNCKVMNDRQRFSSLGCQPGSELLCRHLLHCNR